MILQRYNTYQTYWQRICREIENGTFKRHMMRAQKLDTARTPQRKSVDETTLDAENLPSDDAALQAELDALAELEAMPVKARKVEIDLDFNSEFGALEDPMRRKPSSIRMPAVRPPTPSSRPPAAAPPAARPPGAAPARVWRKAMPSTPDGATPVAQPPAATPAHPPAATPTRSPAPPPLPVRTGAPGPRPPPPPVPARASSPELGPAARPPPPPAARPAARPAGAGELPDDRVRQLYAQYVETKRKQNESTAAITYEGLAKSLRESSAKLREKHGKSVDFEVAVKDGKTILKPVVK
jgi:hypothetical protein